MTRLAIFFLLLFTSLFSAPPDLGKKYFGEEGEAVSSLLDLHGAPQSLVFGCVNVMTGAYHEEATDLFSNSTGSIQFTRFYNSLNEKGGMLGDFWDLNWHDSLQTAYDIYEAVAIVRDKGSVYSFKGKNDRWSASMALEPEVIKWGVVNGVSGVYSGRNNIMNRRLNLRLVGKEAEMVLEGGGSVFYTFKSEPEENQRHYLASGGCLTNGIPYTYKRDSEKRIYEIYSYSNNKKIDAIKIQYLESDKLNKRWKISNDSLGTCEYRFKRMESKIGKHHRYALVDVIKDFAPPVKYSWSTAYRGDMEQMVKKSMPDGRYLSVRYYDYELKEQRGKQVKVDYNQHIFGRVRELKGPIGPDGEERVFYRFVYNLDKGGSYTKKKPIAGSTDVFDALGNKKSYHYSKKLRLTAIEDFEENQNLYRKEKFHWNTPYSEDGSFLTSRTLEAPNGTIQMARNFFYDDEYNVTSEDLIGNLSGLSEGGIEVWAKGFWKGPEVYSKEYFYDSKNRLTKEIDGDVKTTSWFIGDTDRLKQKIVAFGNQFFERVYREYDEYNALSLEIIDDGSSSEIKDLKNVTCRLIKRIENTKASPVGLPEKIREFYWDFKTSSEKILKTSTKKWSKEGWLLNEKEYDANGELAFEKSFKYDKYGNCIFETDLSQSQIRRIFDANNNLIEEELDGIVNQYTYDFSNRLVKKLQIHPDGFEDVFYFTYDLNGRQTSVENRLGVNIRKTYDSQGRVSQVFYPGKGREIQEQYMYDILNNVISFCNRAGGITKGCYTVRGAPYKITHADGTIETLVYNLDGTLKERTDPHGVKTTYAYDAKKRKIEESVLGPKGGLLSTKKWKYNSLNLIEEVDPMGVVTKHSYDGAGRLIQTKINTAVTKFTYDAKGRQNGISVQTDKGQWQHTKMVYDHLDRVIEERVEDEAGSVLKCTRYTLDLWGNKIASSVMTDEGESVTKTVYNTRKQPLLVVQPDGQTTHYRYSDVWLEEFGCYGECATEIDAKGVQSIMIKDPMGNGVIEEVKNPLGDTIRRVLFQYDPLGQLLERHETIYSGTSILRQSSLVKTWDKMGRETSLVEGAGSNSSRHTHRQYNQRGELVLLVKPDKTTIRYKFDYLGRQIGISSSEGSVDEKYAFNKRGDLISYENKINKLIFTREIDENGRLSKESFSSGLTFEYDYDLAGRITHVKLPDKTSIDYRWDPLRLQSIQRNGTSQSYKTCYAFDRSGRLAGCELPFSLGQISYRYDEALKIRGLDCPYYRFAIEDSGYDAVGNLIQLEGEDATGHFTNSYAYDDLNQLVEEKGVFNNRFVFDSAHNRIESDGSSFKIGPCDELLEAFNETFEYDRNGNLTSGSKSANRFRYDALDRLVEVESQSGKTVYEYDGLHRLLAKREFERRGDSFVQTNLELALYQGELEIGRANENGNIIQLRILGIGKGGEVGAAVAIELDSHVFIPLHDLRGNVATLIDGQTGLVVESVRYSAFGLRQISDDTGQIVERTVSPWSFSSKRFDEQSGWFFFGRRWYHAEVGRWTTPDPLYFADGYNRYAYVKNRPLIFIDPYGLYSMTRRDAAYLYSKINFRPYYTFEDRIATTQDRGGNCPHSVFNRSSIEKISGTTNSKMGIGFINGMMTTPEDAKSHAAYISKLAGGREVSYVYNATHGFITDLAECSMNLGGACTTPVKLLHQMWDAFFDEKGMDAYFLQVCHSQGAILTRNALETYDEDRRKRIMVLAVAPGGYINPDTCKSVIHLTSKRDIVPLIDRVGRKYFKETVKILNPHPDANAFDHSFQSPTYQLEMADVIYQFNDLCEEEYE